MGEFVNKKHSRLAGFALASVSTLALGAPAYGQSYNWTGFYIGLNAGGAWGRSNATTAVACALPNNLFCLPTFGQADATAVAASGTGGMSDGGFTGGGQVGFNWQSGNWVYGVEADLEAFNLRPTRQATAAYPSFFGPVGPPFRYTLTSSVDTDWLVTARGRIGWTNANLLTYVTGGLALTNIHAAHTFRDSFFSPATGSWNDSSTKAGWALGGGFEWALGGNWSVKTEYLYLKFGSVNAEGRVRSPSPPGYAHAVSTSVDLTAHIARAGINFRF